MGDFPKFGHNTNVEPTSSQRMQPNDDIPNLSPEDVTTKEDVAANENVD